MAEQVSPSPVVLIVDDSREVRETLTLFLRSQGFSPSSVETAEDALRLLAEGFMPTAIVLDVVLPGIDGYQACRQLKADPKYRYIPTILVSVKHSLQDIIAGFESGADDYITKPFEPGELSARLQAALRLRAIYEELNATRYANDRLIAKLEQLSSRPEGYIFSGVVGKSSVMQGIFRTLERVARQDSPVLITGPTGVGKELVARSIHLNSERSNHPFVAQNCAAFQESLLESELFGHTRGAFTGAYRDKRGLFDGANGGTLFLDEVGELSALAQAKLLRVLQEGVFLPVGGNSERRVDVRVVAATNASLRSLVDRGSFREDLFYRLNVIQISLPPLRERSEDIPLLIEHFLVRALEKRALSKVQLSAEARAKLLAYSWPGNVRELQSEIERLVIFAEEGDTIGEEALSSQIREEEATRQLTSSGRQGNLRAAIECTERRLILQALEHSQWNKSSAAKALGISRSNLINKVQQYGLERARAR